MDDFPEGALDWNRCNGFHNRGGLNQGRTGDALRTVCHGAGYSESQLRWRYGISRFNVDDPDWTKPYGHFQWFPERETVYNMDRDASFHAAFRLLLEQTGVRVVWTPPSSLNCNAHIERFHRSFKTEVAERMIFFGEAHLRRAVDEYLVYYHRERNHQGLDGEIINPEREAGPSQGKICRRERLGGMLNYYHRDSA